MSGSIYKEVPDALQGTWKLTDLEINFVSACPQGANPGAKVMLKKEKILMSKDTKDSTVNVNVDIDALSKAMSENLKMALGDLLAKDKNLSAEAMTEAVVAVVTGDIAKIQKEINDELKKAAESLQKEITEAVEKAKGKKKSKKDPDNDGDDDSDDDMGKSDETLTLNGTSFKKSDVGEHAFQAIKASALQQEALRKEIEHGKTVQRVEKEYPNVAGKPEDKASLLMLLEKADDSVKATGLAVLKALNDAGADFKKEDGRANPDLDKGLPMGKMGSDTEASAKLEKMAQELAKKEGISVAAAYAKVLDTPEGESLYESHREGR